MSDKEIRTTRNAENVKRYQSNLTAIKVRFPSVEACGEDYFVLMKNRAEELGYIIQKGKDKGQGSVNAYILHLVERDLNITMTKGMSEIEK